MIDGSPRNSGELVRLRPYSAGFSEEELRDLYVWSSDPNVTSLSGTAPLDLPFEEFKEQFLSQLSRRNSDTEQLYAILDEEGHMIGRTGLFAINPTARTAELGIVIGDQEKWGHGYGSAAVRALVRIGFGDFGLGRIVLYTYANNERARRAYESAGFRPVRELERFSLQEGTHVELEMEILASEA